MDEVFKNPVFGGGKIDKLAAAGGSLLDRIQFQIRYGEHWSGDTLRAPYESFDPGEQFSQVERFAEIVIRSCVQQVYDRLLAFVGRATEHRSEKIVSTR